MSTDDTAAARTGERTGAPLVAFLTGAGFSTDSGIPDYRGPQGLWRQDPQAVRMVTADDYLADPEVRVRAWRMRLDTHELDARPNAAHLALAELERGGVPLRVLTQNVDGLHQAGGVSPRKVLELHGTARRVRCQNCGAETGMDEALARVTAGEPDPACRRCGGVLRPALVMFGEPLDEQVLGQARAVVAACEILVAVGSSLTVHPAAGLVDLAAAVGARVVIVNAEPTPYDDLADEVVREPIGSAVPTLVRTLLAAGPR